MRADSAQWCSAKACQTRHVHAPIYVCHKQVAVHPAAWEQLSTVVGSMPLQWHLMLLTCSGVL